MMKFNSILPTAVICLCFGLLASGEVNAKPNNFTFTKVADTNGEFSSFFTAASLNNKGNVAFGADLDAGGQGIYTSDGSTTTTIADLSGLYGSFRGFTYENLSSSFSYFNDRIFPTTPSINDQGTVAFVAIEPIRSEGMILTSNGTSRPTPIPTNSSSLPFVAYPSINNAGTVAYLSANFRLTRILTSDGRLVDERNDSRTSAVDSPVINDAGTIAYRQQDGSTFSIVSNSGTTTNTITSTTYPVFAGLQPFGFNTPSLNNKGEVSFITVLEARSVAESPFRTLVPETAIVQKTNGTTTTTITDTSGSFSTFGFQGLNNFFFNPTSISDQGKVAFLATLNTGGEGLFITNKSRKEKVIATGDSLFGYTVVDLTFSREGLNNRGQLTFIAQLANDTQVVVRAEPRRKPN